MGAPSMKFKPFFLSLLTIVFCAAFASAQHLPDMPVKPTPQFESPSFCPPEGKTNSTDPELNRRKNRIDSPSNFSSVDFAEVKTLAAPASAGGKVRSNWTTNERKAIEKFEGIPITIEGSLALVNNAKHGDPPKIEGARPEGKESCNCDSTQPAQIDFHIWLLFAANDNRKDAIVVEMTLRVRAHHPT